MRVLICGGRDFADQALFDLVMAALGAKLATKGLKITEVISGAAKGADTMGEVWATANNIPLRCFPANWSQHGKAAGPLRNEQMLVEGKPNLVVAFHGGSGTRHMVHIARKAGVKVAHFTDSNAE